MVANINLIKQESYSVVNLEKQLSRTVRMLTFFGYTIQIMQINISEYNIFIAPIIHPGR